MKKFNNFVNGTFLSLKARKDAFMKDERGVSAIVATILLILIVVLLAAAFWKYLSKWFNDMMEQIFGTENSIGKGDLNSPS